MSLAAEGDLPLDDAAKPARTARFAPARSGRIVLKLVVSAGLLIWLFSQVDLSEVTLVAAGDWRPLLFAWLIQSLLPFVQAQRWRMVAAALGARLPFASAAKNVFIGQFFNQILPSSIGGDAVRLWKAAKFMPVPTALSSIALDRLVALLAIPLILAIGSGILLRIVPEGPARWSLLAVIAAAAIALALLLTADRIPLPRALLRLRVVEVLRTTPQAARRLFRNPACLARTLALSIVIHCGVGMSLFALASRLGVDAPVAAFLLLAPLVTLVTTVPISLGGWGVREGAVVTALGFLDVPSAVALSVSIQFGLVMMVVGLPGGVLAVLDPAGQRPGKRPAEEAA